MTESYGSSVDPPEKNPPVCLIHTFPHAIEHCLQWARELLFEGRFVADADIVNKYLNNAGFLEVFAVRNYG
jgi:ubiquitin-activating enzyme E1